MERSTLRRKLMRISFWLIIIYTAISTTIVWTIQFGFVQLPPRTLDAAEQKEKEENVPTYSEIAFAEQFVREYLFWTQGREDSRAERLKPFWKSNKDVQGGLDFSKASWNSYARNVAVWDVKERADGSGIKDITVFAETVLTHVKNENEQKRVDRYLIVPIQKAGSSYFVVDPPTFISPPVAEKIVESEEQNRSRGEAVNSTVSKEVEEFMRSFWKVYTTGEPNEIAYFQKNNQPRAGLTGIMKFLNLNQLTVRKINETYRVECNVEMEDLASGAKLSLHYPFELVKEGNRWYVVKMGEGEMR